MQANVKDIGWAFYGPLRLADVDVFSDAIALSHTISILYIKKNNKKREEYIITRAGLSLVHHINANGTREYRTNMNYTQTLTS